MQFIYKTKITQLDYLKQDITELYLNVREHFSESILLEASEYRPNEHCYSFIAANPLAEVSLDKDVLKFSYPNGKTESKTLVKNEHDLVAELDGFFAKFEIDSEDDFAKDKNGFFGYTSYDAVRYFDTLKLKPLPEHSIPVVCYRNYEFVFVINNYKEEVFLLHNQIDSPKATDLKIQDVIKLNQAHSKQGVGFQTTSELTSNISLEEHGEIVNKSKEYIAKGDIFQIVPSRSYSQDFKGDEFLVYQELKKINPSPYLFYFDYSNFKIFGSSPEAAILVQDGKAILHPIAGTVPNYPDPKKKAAIIEKLIKDPKENSEHVMLVDLARNDLSKHSVNVTVDKYREVQEFSHVLHLVSVVSGELTSNASAYQLLADTFPAGTLSGAPKYRAMEIIDKLEPDCREFYGGALGLLTFSGELIHAIMIRTFLSRNQTLTRRAGGGIVAESQVESEVAEVENKLMALKKAIIAAQAGGRIL